MTSVETLSIPAVPSDGMTGLAPVLVAKRRELGLDLDGLAAAASVTVPVVARAEQGGAVSPMEGRALLAALGVDPTPLVPGTPEGPVAVPAVDGDHRHAMDYLAEVAAGERGWLLFADVAYLGRDAGRIRSAIEVEEATRCRKVTRRVILPCVANCAIGLAGVVYLDHGYLDPAAVLASPWWWTLPLSAGCAIVGLVGAVWGGESLESRSGDLARLSDEADERDALTRQAWLVSARGVIQLEATPGGLVRREYLASATKRVEVTGDGPAHVTVRMRTIVGDVTMRGVPRVRDVVDLVSSWGRAPHRSSEGLQ